MKNKIRTLRKNPDFKIWNKAFLQKSDKTLRKTNSENSFDVLIGTTYVHNILLPFVVKNTTNQNYRL